MKVLLSIKPEFVKKFEYRKRLFKKAVDTVVIYSTLPEGKVVGEFTIGDLLQDDKMRIWEQTKEFAGIDFKFYEQYFEGSSQACAIGIDKISVYNIPLTLEELQPGLKAPQSFCYIN